MPEHRLVKTRLAYQDTRSESVVTVPGQLTQRQRVQMEAMYAEGVSLETIARMFGGQVYTWAEAGLTRPN